MYKSNKRLIDILFVVLVASFIGMLAGSGYIYSLNNKKEKKDEGNLTKIDEMYNMIVEKYYQDVDKDTIAEAAISGMLSVLDKNTTYMDSATTNNFNKKMQGEYYGIGIEALTVDKGTMVISTIKDSPAYNAGIQDGDIIISVNKEKLEGKSATFFTDLVAKTSDELKLVISRDGREINIDIIPEKIVIQSVNTNKFVMNGKNIGYINISIFAANTASQFSVKLKSLEENKIDALIIDVRNNSGGYLSQASSILELFMPKDTILYQTESKTSLVKRKDETEEQRNYPVAILVNESSASASEVLASCFMENTNSIIIGTRTYGKGTVQETINVLDNSKAKITTKKWLTPKGNWIDEKGITPNIIVELSDKYLVSPIIANDNQLDRAISELSM